MRLTERNYFSPEADMKYFGHTQFVDFMDCPARALATCKGEWQMPLTDALLAGQYVDAALTGSVGDVFCQHPEMLKKDGTLKATFAGAERAVARAQRDNMFMKYMDGVTQKIMTGKLFGYEWKIKIDAFHEGKCIVDLKCMKDFENKYVDGKGRVSFVEAWGYDYQAAIYQAIVEDVTGEKLPFIIAGVTKQDPSDIGLFEIPQYMIDSALKVIENNIDRFAMMKAGEIEAPRCDNCAYCRGTKVLDKIVTIEQVGE
jgi:hypothetical protein